MANNKPNKHNPNNQNNGINVGFTTNTQFVLSISKNSYSNNFVHFIHHQFVHFIDHEEPGHGLMNNFVHFIHHYMNSRCRYYKRQDRWFRSCNCFEEIKEREKIRRLGGEVLHGQYLTQIKEIRSDQCWAWLQN